MQKNKEKNTIKNFTNKIICGDATETLKEIPDASVDTVFVDPPFNLKKKYANILALRVIFNHFFFIFARRFAPFFKDLGFVFGILRKICSKNWEEIPYWVKFRWTQNFAGQKISQDKYFATKPKFRNVCPAKFCPIKVPYYRKLTINDFIAQ